MDAMILLTLLLTLSNLVTLGFLIRAVRQKKAEIPPEVEALHRALRTFEKEGHCLLSIAKIDPDSVFLRSPGGR